MAAATCDRCGTGHSPAVEAVAQGWSRFEALKEDGETIYYVTVCPACLTDAEEAGTWPVTKERSS
jgi:hypothetical protein